MKKGILFVAAFVCAAAGFALLIHATNKTGSWYTMLPLILLPAATIIYLKVNFKTDDHGDGRKTTNGV